MAIAGDALTTRKAVEARLRGGKADRAGVALNVFLLLSLIISLGVLVILLTDIVVRAIPAFAERGSDVITAPLSARPARAGMIQGIVGSLILTAFVILIALPFGVGAAVYLEEYARDSALTRFFRTNIRNLAGVPSIVYGLLGLAVFVTLLGLGQSAIAGGLTLAILVLPIIVITTSEALRAVPISIREAAFGVGATRWETIRSHVLPYAAPGVLTGTILALARAFGETAPLILVGAVVGTFNSIDPVGMLTGSYTALPTIVFNWAREPQDEFRALTAAAIVVLLVVILLVNAAAIFLRNRYDRRW
jgi:phosphate transport system permease protein